MKKKVKGEKEKRESTLEMNGKKTKMTMELLLKRIRKVLKEKQQKQKYRNIAYNIKIATTTNVL